MELNDFLGTCEYRTLLDEGLRKHAQTAVKTVIELLPQPERPRLVQRSQIQSISSVLQSSGVAGLVVLAANQKEKNSKAENKVFWTFLHAHLTKESDPSTLSGYVLSVLKEKGLVQDIAQVVDKAEQGKLKNLNRVVSQKFMESIGVAYFEHFVCHYYYQCAIWKQEALNVQ